MTATATVLLAVIVIVSVSSCYQKPQARKLNVNKDTDKAAIGAFGIDLSGGDFSVRPGNDFWTYANGRWAKQTKIPSDRASAGQLDVLTDKAENNVRLILTDLANDPGKYGRSGEQIGNLYGSWMDTVALEKNGTKPLKPYLDRISAIASKHDLEVLFATTDFAAPVGIDVVPDPANPKQYTAIASQGELGLSRDNYLLVGQKYDEIRKDYRTYVQRIQEMAGVPDAAKKADVILTLEKAMAKAQWSSEQMRDFAAIYKPMNRTGMKALAPGIDWEVMLATAGLDNVSTVVMAGDGAIAQLSKMLNDIPMQTWKDWMTFQFINTHATYLNKAMDDAKFNFYSKQLLGVQGQSERWKRGVRLVNGALGEAVGKFYVQRYYATASETKMKDLVDNLRSALNDVLHANRWMDKQTRDRALVKLAAFETRIGHPKNYIDYSSLQIRRGDLLGNMIRANIFQHKLSLTRFGKPVDRALWEMTPQTVNAYYNPLTNQITFPAAFLQPPFFDPNADAAVNYGAIGAVIGHEMGHGFDDQGSKFGPDGTFGDWWTPEARKAFTDRASKLVAQYNEYEPVKGTKINGALTVGENIGDQNGVVTAYAAYQKYRKSHGSDKVINGLTGDQRFFLAYAQIWRELVREDALRQVLKIDAHSPGKFRVNGVLRNIDAWYKAFNVAPGDKLYLKPEQRVVIW